MRNFWCIVSPLRGWHPKTAGAVDYFPSRRRSHPAVYCSQVLQDGKETGNENGEARDGKNGLLRRCIILRARTVQRHLRARRELRAMPWFTVRVSCVSCLREAQLSSCPGYNPWVVTHVRNVGARIKNCFLRAQPLHKLISYMLGICGIPKNTRVKSCSYCYAQAKNRSIV